MKKTLIILSLFFLAVSLIGCDAVQRKFTRKKKTVKAPRIYQINKYEIKPSPELYEKHYSYWMSWQSEIIQDLGQNKKKDKRCIEEILMQLGSMQSILVEEKARELGKHIARLEEVRDTIVKEQIDQFNRSNTLIVLEREDRLIKSNFDVTRMKKYIKESFDETPQESAAAEEE